MPSAAGFVVTIVDSTAALTGAGRVALGTFGKGNNLRPHGPDAEVRAVVTCAVVSTVVGSMAAIGEGDEK